MVTGIAGFPFPVAVLGSLAGDHEGRRHLVQIFDIGLLPEYEGRAFMVMEYVEGEPLFNHLRAVGKFSVGAGLRFFLRSVAVPLIGFDAGYGIEAHSWQFILVIGA